MSILGQSIPAQPLLFMLASRGSLGVTGCLLQKDASLLRAERSMGGKVRASAHLISF